MDKETRNAIERATQKARRLLEEEFEKQLVGDFDVLLDGTVARRGGDHLTPRQHAVRERITASIAHRKAAGGKPAEAVASYVRDAAFTTLNRFVALKMLEARGLLLECVSRGEQSSGYGEFHGLAPGLKGLPDGAGYRLYLESLFDELSTEIRVLFDRRDPASALWPRKGAFDSLLEVLNATELSHVWAEDETIGWVYQYFNSGDERRAMRDASQAPRNSRELAVRNQFFTPRYVVRFLTENTLARIWIEMMGEATRIAERCDFLVHDVESRGPRTKKDPRDLKILDPACGSGHFLLYAFDLLLFIYEEAWADPDAASFSGTGRFLRQDYPDLAELRKAAPLFILEQNLHGVDIDPRCAQIAALALWLRAQRAWKDAKVPASQRPRVTRTHIVVAEPMPGDESLVDEFASTLNPPLLGTLFRKMVAEMRLAGELGTLLRIETLLADEVRKASEEFNRLTKTTGYLPGLEPPRLQGELDFSKIDDNAFFAKAEEMLLSALRRFAESASGGNGAQKRLFAGDAAQGIALVDIVGTTYDVVLMNPPFGESAAGTSGCLRREYPNSCQDLAQCFVERALERTRLEGAVGVLGPRTGFFLGDSEGWRRDLLQKHSLSHFSDLGLGVLDDALVEAAAFVIRPDASYCSHIWASRQLATQEKEEALLGATKAGQQSQSGLKNAYSVRRELVLRLPGAVLGYWAPERFLARFGSERLFRDEVAPVRQGLATGEDFRFVRLAWEVDANSVGTGKRWQPFSKGGEYAPPYDDIHLLVNWMSDGRELRSLSSTRVQNDSFYFKPGATYTVRTASAFAAKILPAGCIFSHNAQSWFHEDLDTVARSLLFFLTRPAQAFVEVAVGGGDVATSGSAARRYTTAVIHAIPAGAIGELEVDESWEDLKAALRLIAFDQGLDETSRLFGGINPSGVRSFEELQRFLALQRQRLVTRVLEMTLRLDRSVGLSMRLSSDELEFVRSEIGPHPCEYSRDVPPEEVRPLLQVDIEGLVRACVQKDGPARWSTKKAYFADRKTELVCHLARCHPAVVERCLEDGAGVEAVSAADVVSYMVGIAFERWSGDTSASESDDTFVAEPFAELPQRPPAACPIEGSVPSGATRCLDDRGLERVVGELTSGWGRKGAAEFDFGWERWLGVGLGEYLRASFFGTHLSRYSKSRRKAPIYWQLGTASASYSVWLYAHRLTPDTFFHVLHDVVAPKLALEERRLQSLAQESGPSPTASQRRGIVAQEAFVDELRTFRDEVARVAPLWRPNLDDGVLLTMAPLWRLVPQHRAWQKELKAAWDSLSEGEYDWAHAAMHLWPERVVPKCAKDRSFAIAHNLEDVFWEEDSKGKWVARQKPLRPIEELVRERTSPAVKAALKDLLEAPVAGAAAKGAGRGRKRKA